MPIPLDLNIQITQVGLEIFQQVQQAVASAMSAVAAGERIGAMETGISGVASSLGNMTPALQTATQQMHLMALNAGTITPDALATLAASLATARTEVLTLGLSLASEAASSGTTKVEVDRIWAAHVRFADQITSIIDRVNTLTGAFRTEAGAAGGLSARITGTTSALQTQHRAAWNAINSMNVMSSVSAGLMMGMGALRGSLMSVGFGLIFLKFSIAPLTLAVAGLVVAVGGTIKSLSKMGEAFETQVSEPLGRIKAAIIEAWGYFAGPVWMKIIIPTINILADLAEGLRNLAGQVWLSAGVQQAWTELLARVADTFAHLGVAMREHGGTLKWLVRTGFIAAIDVLKGLLTLINVAITLLPQFGYLWQRIAGDFKGAWDAARLVAAGLKGLGLGDVLQRLKEFTFGATLEEILLVGLGVLTGKTPLAILAVAMTFAADLIAGLLGIDNPEFRRKWREFWDWVAIGVFAGLVFGQPILVGVGALIGLMMVFKEELFRIFFDIRGKLAEWALSVGNILLPVFKGIEEVLPSFMKGPMQALIDNLSTGMVRAEAEVKRHDLWAALGKPTPETLEEWMMPIDEWLAKVKRGVSETLGGGGLLTSFTATAITAAPMAPAAGAAGARPYPGIYAGGLGGAPVVVDLSGSTFYGNLDENLGRKWADQFGTEIMKQMSGRWGFALP